MAEMASGARGGAEFTAPGVPAGGFRLPGHRTPPPTSTCVGHHQACLFGNLQRAQDKRPARSPRPDRAERERDRPWRRVRGGGTAVDSWIPKLLSKDMLKDLIKASETDKEYQQLRRSTPQRTAGHQEE